MIPTLLLVGVVLGRWWRIVVPLAAAVLALTFEGDTLHTFTS